MEDEKNWKLKLKHGLESTEYKHYTVIGDGLVGNLSDGFICKKGPAFMGIKTWATDSTESANMLKVIGEKIGFKVTGEIRIYESEPEEPPRENPFGYGINFTPYEK